MQNIKMHIAIKKYRGISANFFRSCKEYITVENGLSKTEYMNVKLMY